MTDELEQAKGNTEQWHLGQTSAAYESGAAGAGAISTGRAAVGPNSDLAPSRDDTIRAVRRS